MGPRSCGGIRGRKQIKRCFGFVGHIILTADIFAEYTGRPIIISFKIAVAFTWFFAGHRGNNFFSLFLGQQFFGIFLFFVFKR